MTGVSTQDAADRIPLFFVSAWLGIPMLALRQLQREGCGPDTFHVAGVTYVRSNDLDRWLDSCRRAPGARLRTYDPQQDSTPPGVN